MRKIEKVSMIRWKILRVRILFWMIVAKTYEWFRPTMFGFLGVSSSFSFSWNFRQKRERARVQLTELFARACNLFWRIASDEVESKNELGGGEDRLIGEQGNRGRGCKEKLSEIYWTWNSRERTAVISGDFSLWLSHFIEWWW